GPARTPTRQRFLTVRSGATLPSPMLECELHRDRHDDRHRNAVQKCRCVSPLPHGNERRLIAQWHRSQHARRLDDAARVDDGFDDDESFDMTRLRELRIDRRDVDDLARLADAYVEPHRSHGRRGQCDHDTYSTRPDPVEGSNRGWTVGAADAAERMLESLGSDAIRHDRW